MKIISLIYVFALFIILVPNIFISYDKQFGVLLHSTLFVIIFYLTYDGVMKEGFYEREINVQGMGHLADLFDDHREESESNKVVINNEIRKPKHIEIGGQTNAKLLLKNSLNKINTMRDENEFLQNKIDAYKGHDEAVDKLREKEKESQETIEQLQTQVRSMRGNENAVSKLNGIIQDLQLKNSQLNLQLTKNASK
jgi:hypothetical protein